jgi:UDP-N-acetylmuramate--alanine ligase
MRALPLDIGMIHFVGIGGIGMSGIAEILHNLGYQVQGSDIADGGNTQRLRALGIPVEIGHRPENLGGAQVVVISSAVKPDNPEVTAARARLLPVVRRAEMLGELMRLKWSIAVAGTHGKTTTTSIIGALLDAAQLDPTVINGGIINAYGTNARLGAGDWMVVEADESDGTFVKLPATIAVITNIDPEHLDFYGNFEAVQRAFDAFVANIPFYGFAALCIDHPVVQGLIPKLSERRIVTYGLSPQADIRAVNIDLGPNGARYDVVITDRAQETSRTIVGLKLPMFGQHNVQNSLAAVAVAEEMGLGEDVIRTAFAGFKGVKRRFTKTGEARGVTVIDDYGHHPVEIAAVLHAARGATTGASSPSCSRIASRGCAISSPSSAPASTTPMPSSSPRSMPRARRRSRASTGTRWWRDCAPVVIAAPSRCPRRQSSPPWCASWRSPVILSSASVPARSPTGRRACRPSSLTSMPAEKAHDGGAPDRQTPHRAPAAGARPAQREGTARARHLVPRRRRRRGDVPPGRCRGPRAVPRRKAG